MAITIANIISKAKKLIYPPTYQKLKNYIDVAENGIKESADFLMPNAIFITRLDISHLFLKICSKKEKTSRKKR